MLYRMYMPCTLEAKQDMRHTRFEMRSISLRVAVNEFVCCESDFFPNTFKQLVNRVSSDALRLHESYDQEKSTGFRKSDKERLLETISQC